MILCIKVFANSGRGINTIDVALSTLMDASGSKDELAEFEIKHLDLDELTDENCVGRGSYGAAFRVHVDGVPRIAKRIHNILLDPSIIPSEKKSIQERFYRECVLLSRVDHPNVVEFVGVYFNPSDRRDVTLIMELLYMPLESLLNRDKHPNIPLSVKLHILRDVSLGLLYLHNRPVIHRDLTVTNILLTRDLQAKIVDLGVSKLLSSSDIQKQTMCPGNFSYMPPEALCENPNYDTSLDVFSFGHLSLHVYIQQYPTAFGVFHSQEMQEAASSGELEIFRRKKWIEMVLHDCLKDVILICLRDRPEERPSTKKLTSVMKTLCARHPKSLEDVITALGDHAQVQFAAEKSEIQELTDKIDDLGQLLEAKDSQIQQLTKKLKTEDDKTKETKLKSRYRTIEELRTQVKKLSSENAHKDAQIKKLKQEHHWNVNENRSSETDCTFDLNWVLESKPCGELVVLGSGSYGKVYKGCCKNTGRHLAVKVVLDLTQKAADDLEKEVKQLSQLNRHKRVVTYLGACYADHPRFKEKCLYVFTEFMPGGSLSSCLEKGGPLTQVLARRYTRQILEGVEYLHQCKVIHRDIKGSNIMCDTAGNVKLADFGSAKQVCTETLDKDKTKYLCGTAPWAAPEVLRGEKAQTHSDIWSVAATVVEMLTGVVPYKSEKFDNSMAIIFQVGGNKLNPLKSLKRGGYEKLLTDDVETFLNKCFKSEAKERPSASTLLSNFPFCKC